MLSSIFTTIVAAVTSAALAVGGFAVDTDTTNTATNVTTWDNSCNVATWENSGNITTW